MKPPSLTLSAATLDDLYAQLRAIDIAVPPVTEKQTKDYRERYMMARFLATVAKAGRVTFPLDLVHRDKPDFHLRFGKAEVGVELVEAVPQELYEIELLRERRHPEAMNFGQRFRPGKSNYTSEEKSQIASGEFQGPPWTPETAKQNWVAAMVHVIRGKIAKLHAGNYSSTAMTWLLVQDEWPTPLGFYAEQLREAALECALSLSGFPEAPSFHSIYIASGTQLLCFKGAGLSVEEINDLWK